MNAVDDISEIWIREKLSLVINEKYEQIQDGVEESSHRCSMITPSELALYSYRSLAMIVNPHLVAEDF